VVQILKRRDIKEDSEGLISYLGRIDEKVDLMTKLISDFLDISKIEAGKFEFSDERFDLDALIEDVLVDFRNRGFKIVKRGEVPSFIEGDGMRIMQVLVNLISNAIEYSSIKKHVIVSSSGNNDYAIVNIRDFGEGIKKTDQKNIFEPFYQVKNGSIANPGLGLGLYISKEIIERHGGIIGVKSALGKGSTFTFTLPYKLSNIKSKSYQSFI